MAFGRIKKRRDKKEKKAAKKAQAREEQRRQELAAAQDPERIAQDMEQTQGVVNQQIDAQKERDDQRAEEFRQQSMQDVHTDVGGMSDEQKRAMQESANANINSQVQNYSRAIASRTGRAGIRGGAAEAPQAELSQYGMQAQNQFQRDLIEEDSKVALQKLAAWLSSFQGYQANDILRQQQLRDDLTGRQDRERDRINAQYYNKDYARA